MNIPNKLKQGISLLLLLSILIAAAYVSQWQGRYEKIVMLRHEFESHGMVSSFRDVVQEWDYFPVRPGDHHTGWYYEDGYGAPRTYGGRRSHEGIDILSEQGKRNELQIQSVCDGVIEQIGWLKLGGYRVGIRGKSGLYYYYAHLASYAPGLGKGDRVRAGQWIGMMGDTGYGPEGTTGQFVVHLHFGIYYKAKNGDRSLNPFPFLRYMEGKSWKL